MSFSYKADAVVTEKRFAPGSPIKSILIALNNKPTIENGNLKEVPIPALLFLCYQDGVSGILSCTRENVTKKLHFDQGAIIFADSSLKEEQLLNKLSRSGRLIPEEIESVERCVEKTGMRIDTALLKLGIVPVKELNLIVNEHSLKIVLSLFEWNYGEYKFEPWAQSDQAIESSLHTPDAIIEGIRNLNNIDLIKQWIGSFKLRLRITTNPLLLYQYVELNPREGFIISRMEQEKTVEDMLALAGLGEEEMLRSICGLIAIGMIEPASDLDKAEQISPTELIESMLTYTEPPQQSQDFSTMAEICYEIESKLRNIEFLDAYSILETNRQADDEEIEAAYRRMKEKFHPEHHSQILDYNPNLRMDLESIINAITNAYEMLNTSYKRTKYNSMWRTGQFKVPRSSLLED
jgi:hypothetical protein